MGAAGAGYRQFDEAAREQELEREIEWHLNEIREEGGPTASRRGRQSTRRAAISAMTRWSARTRGGFGAGSGSPGWRKTAATPCACWLAARALRRLPYWFSRSESGGTRPSSAWSVRCCRAACRWRVRNSWCCWPPNGRRAIHPAAQVLRRPRSPRQDGRAAPAYPARKPDAGKIACRTNTGAPRNVQGYALILRSVAARLPGALCAGWRNRNALVRSACRRFRFA